MKSCFKVRWTRRAFNANYETDEEALFTTKAAAIEFASFIEKVDKQLGTLCTPRIREVPMFESCQERQDSPYVEFQWQLVEESRQSK